MTKITRLCNACHGNNLSAHITLYNKLKYIQMKTDLEIQKDVMDELKWEPLLNASEIGVSVKDGVVTLSGKLDSFYKKVRAEKAAKRVQGVRAVAEDIEIKLEDSIKKTDAEIAQAVLDALKWHSAIQEDRLKVTVDNGIVTVEGDVDWKFQKDSVRIMIEKLNGVKGIINNISVKAKVVPKEIKSKINAAFHRSATLDSNKISVITEGNKVILNGNVRSLAEKKDAERAAWFAPGVEEVENNLEVSSDVFAL